MGGEAIRMWGLPFASRPHWFRLFCGIRMSLHWWHGIEGDCRGCKYDNVGGGCSTNGLRSRKSKMSKHTCASVRWNIGMCELPNHHVYDQWHVPFEKCLEPHTGVNKRSVPDHCVDLAHVARVINTSWFACMCCKNYVCHYFLPREPDVSILFGSALRS